MLKMKNYADVVECANCGEKFSSVEELIPGIDGRLYCESCHAELFATCEHCGDLCYRDDTASVYVGHAGWEEWCPNCVDDFAFECEDCGDLTSNDCRNYIDGEDICDDCVNHSSRYEECVCCGEIHIVDNMSYSDRQGGYACDDCYNDCTVINSYHSGPRPLLWLSDNPEDKYNRKHKLFVGVELEIDKGGENDGNAEAIAEAGAHTPNQDITCESDGSLTDGFEIISTTATVDYHIRHYGWAEMMQEAIEQGYTSHDAGTCGLHVHMDRRYFADMFSNPEEVLSIIVCNNAEWLKTFSRRNRWQYCSFPNSSLRFTAEEFKRKDKYGRELSTSNVRYKVSDAVSHMRGHGSCMNFCGYATLEVRFNRGTLVWDTFKATLQFIQLLADIAKSCSHLKQACEVNLRTFRQLAKRRGYKEFLAYLKRRNIQ